MPVILATQEAEMGGLRSETTWTKKKWYLGMTLWNRSGEREWQKIASQACLKSQGTFFSKGKPSKFQKVDLGRVEDTCMVWKWLGRGLWNTATTACWQGTNVLYADKCSLNLNLYYLFFFLTWHYWYLNLSSTTWVISQSLLALVNFWIGSHVFAQG
jgi:hypothetical protein